MGEGGTMPLSRIYPRELIDADGDIVYIGRLRLLLARTITPIWPFGLVGLSIFATSFTRSWRLGDVRSFTTIMCIALPVT